MHEKQLQNITLVELIIRKTHLRWYTATGILAVLLLSGLIITAFYEKTPFFELGWDFWRVGLQGPAIIIYILVIFPFMTRIGNDAFESIIPLVDMNEKEMTKLLSKYYQPPRSGEWISLSMGVVIILALSQPWRGNFEFFNTFLFITEIIMFGLLALLIFYGFHKSRYLTLMNRHLKLDIFNLDTLTPVARWSFSVSLAFIGGIIISIIFQTLENLMQWQIILIYIILILSTLAMFFITMWSTHTTIVKVKQRELELVQNRLSVACRSMISQADREKTKAIMLSIMRLLPGAYMRNGFAKSKNGRITQLLSDG